MLLLVLEVINAFVPVAIDVLHNVVAFTGNVLWVEVTAIVILGVVGIADFISIHLAVRFIERALVCVAQ